MYNQMLNLLQRSYVDKYNIICAPTHERIESYIAQTNHNFYAWRKYGVFKPGWNESFAKIPKNYILLDESRGDNQLYPWVSPHIVFSQNKFGQFQILNQLAQRYDIPLISLEHTAFMPWWNKDQAKQLQEMRGKVNVFITEWSLNSWDWEDRGDTFVIPHCVDSELFKSDESLERKNYILTVGNDYIGRDSVLDFARYKRVVIDNNLPRKPVGDTPGLSKAPSNVEELIKEYQSASIFLNTHHISPVPTSLLEAASCGCGIVTCNTAGIPEFFTHGKNALLYNNDKEMEEYLRLLLKDKDLAMKLGENAHSMILEKCQIDRFVNQWKMVFDLVMEK